MGLRNYFQALLIVVFFYGCTDSSVSTKDSFNLQGLVLSSFDQSVISNTEVLLNGVVVDTTDQNGRFVIEDLEVGDYTFKIRAVKDHRALEISRFTIISSDINVTYFMPFKYNLIESINSSESIIQANALIESFNTESSPTILNDESRISFSFNNYIFATDTIEFSYFHESRSAFNLNGEPLFEHGISLDFLNTPFEANLLVNNYNDEVPRTIRFIPSALGQDSTRDLQLSIIPNSQFTVDELNLLYFTSY